MTRLADRLSPCGPILDAKPPGRPPNCLASGSGGARLGPPFARPGGAAPGPTHKLNGTAVAISRTLIAVVENGQREDGSVALPQALVDAGAPASIPA